MRLRSVITLVLLCFYKSIALGSASELNPSIAPKASPIATVTIPDWHHQYYDGVAWQNFEQSINHKLNICQRESKWSSARLTIDGRIYVFDFLRMTQLDNITKKQRAIRWLRASHALTVAHPNSDFIEPPFVYANPFFGSDGSEKAEIVALQPLEKMPTTVSFEGLIKTDYLFASVNDGAPGSSVRDMIYALKTQPGVNVYSSCGTTDPKTLTHLHQLRAVVGNAKYLEIFLQNAMLQKLCEWCAQRVPTPLVEFVCGTTNPNTAQHLEALKRLIGSEFQIILAHRQNHLNVVASSDHDVIQEFNQHFARFVVLADKGTAVTPEEENEKEASRISANNLAPSLRNEFQTLLREMMLERRARAQAQAQEKTEGTVDSVTSKMGSLFLNNPPEPDSLKRNNPEEDVAGAAVPAPAPAAPASDSTPDDSDEDERERDEDNDVPMSRTKKRRG